MLTLKLTIPIEPLPQPRPRFSYGRCYQPARIVEYKAEIAKAARLAMKDSEPMTGELSAVIRLYRKYKRCSRRFGDFDNLAKAITDACNGIVFTDDSQIVRCSIEKFTDKEKPRVEVEIQELPTV